MAIINVYRKLQRSLLHNAEKSIRYQHHISFISTYIKLNQIPKGFKLKFHNNIDDANYKNILKKCSRKLMSATVAIYKNKLRNITIRIKSFINDIKINFPENMDASLILMNKRSKKLKQILYKRRESKFTRDKVDSRVALELSTKTLDNLNCPNDKIDLKEAILKDQIIPSYDPLNLDRNNNILEPGLVSLCSKGPSYVPTPSHYDWLQLQKDFDLFRNRVRARYMFSNVSNETSYVVPPNEPPNEPPKRKSTWVSTKTSSPELETFLSNIERQFFENTARKNVSDNLSIGERRSLNE